MVLIFSNNRLKQEASSSSLYQHSLIKTVRLIQDEGPNYCGSRPFRQTGRLLCHLQRQWIWNILLRCSAPQLLQHGSLSRKHGQCRMQPVHRLELERDQQQQPRCHEPQFDCQQLGPVLRQTGCRQRQRSSIEHSILHW